MDKTVGLCLITNKPVNELVELYRPYFDHIYIQRNDKAGEKFVKALSTSSDEKEHYSYFEWCDDFAAARNALVKEVKTDYWVWMDSDDVLDSPENIRNIVRHMAETGVVYCFAPYIYQTDESGNPTEVQNRERVFKTGIDAKWVGRVHETFIPNGAVESEHTDLVKWIHQKTADEMEESTVRNRQLMLKAWAEDLIDEEPDARYAYYLGLNYAMTGEHREAIKWFLELVDRSGWDEEIYRAYLQIGSSFQQLQEYDNAIAAYRDATTVLPSWPDAYFGLQQVYYEIDSHEKSLEWFKVGQSKPNPDSNSAFNPVVRLYQPLILAAYSYLAIGEVVTSVKTLGQLKKLNPSYGNVAVLEPVVIKAYHDLQAIEAAKTLIGYNAKYKGDPKATLDSLPSTLKADIRLTNERRKLNPGSKWAKDSVAYYCGGSFEPWGPDTLEQGMGGSEEAVVYLSREFMKQGKKVVVYNQRDEQYLDYGDGKQSSTKDYVLYQPWTEINPADEFDVFVAWRSPVELKNIKARVKLCDVHDLIDPRIVYNHVNYVDKYLFKSQWHRERYPELPNDKCLVIGNGILKEQFA